MYEAMILDNSSEVVYTSSGASILDAVHAVYLKNLGAVIQEDPQGTTSTDETMVIHALALPDQPNEVRSDLWVSDAPLLILWGIERMKIPLGIVRRLDS